MRTVSMVAAGLATAAAILGWHVLKRNRAARVGLSILAVPLFLCGLVTGGFLASVVAASVAMLWLAPARHWFDGTTPHGRPEDPARIGLLLERRLDRRGDRSPRRRPGRVPTSRRCPRRARPRPSSRRPGRRTPVRRRGRCPRGAAPAARRPGPAPS